MHLPCPAQTVDSRCRLFFLSTPSGMARSIIADIGKRITRLQAEHNLAQYHVTVFETSGGLHAHSVFVGNSDVVRALKGSGAFIKIRAIFDANKLARRYLIKERSPQAGYGRNHLLGGRLRGSHRLDGGGDRVRLSRALERDAIDAGYVESWQHTNARRHTQRKGYRLRRLYPPKAPRLAGQIPLPLANLVGRSHAFETSAADLCQLPWLVRSSSGVGSADYPRLSSGA
jgi:hypothetical protein